MEERRQIKRIGTSLFIKFSIEDDVVQKHESFTQDMSISGARLLSFSRPSINDNLELSIDVPNNPDITIAEGNVRWVGEKALKDDIGRDVFPVGVEFTFMDRQDRVYLEEFLNRQVII